MNSSKRRSNDAEDPQLHNLIERAEVLKGDVAAIVRELTDALAASVAKLHGRSDPRLTRVLRQGASAGENLRRSLEGQAIGDLAQRAGRWARSNPGLVVGGGLLLGIAVAHLASRDDQPETD